MSSDIDITRDELACELVPRVNTVIVSVDNIILLAVLVISFVPVALVSIQIDNHKLADLMPQLQVMGNESNVRIDTETTALACSGVMEPTTKVDSPPMLQSHTCCLNTTKTRTLHRLK